MSIQVCRDPSDAVALYLPQRLYLKPYAKINISVQLPQKVHGKAISSWELMEKIRKMVHPDTLSVLKVSKHSADVIRFDAELEDKNKLDSVIARLEDRIVQLTDYPDALRVKVSEAKSDFPSRHSWDAFFRDTTDMDEMKPGERPDTIHISNLPISWFVHYKERDSDAPPSESIFKKVFEKFGSIRQIDIPAADPFRMQMKTALRGVTIPLQEASLFFEGYIQYNEYVSFVRCMDALRGQKLLRKKEELAEWCSMKVDFDKTKHMTDAAVKRRAIVRDKLLARKRAKEDEERAEKERLAKLEAKERHKVEKAELEKLDKMRQREEKRKKKQLVKLMEKDNLDINSAVAEEERKLLKVQMKLQALRLAEELFKRIELRPQQRRNGTRPERYYRTGGMAARARIIEQYKREQEDLLDKQRDRLKQALEGRIVIRTALDKKPLPRRDSISSLSSEDEKVVHKRIKTEKLSTPERETEYKKALGMYSMHPPFGFGYPFAACPPTFPAAFPQTSMYYGGVQGMYYPPPAEYAPRRPYMRRGRGRGMQRGNGRYYNRYEDNRNEHDDRRTRSRSRGRSYTRSRSRSRSRRSRSRRRSYTRSRSKSRGRRSRSHHHRSRSRSRSRSHKRSNDRRSRTKSRSKSKHRTPPKEPEQTRTSVDSSKFVSPNRMRQKSRSRSWSLPKENTEKNWSKSPKDK